MSDNATESAKSRSPNYPLFDLKEAVEKAGVIYEKEKMHAAALSVIVSHWGYSGLNGRSRRALAALNAYGLLEYVGGGSAKLTKPAQIIILKADGYAKVLRDAALSPKINSELWDRYRVEGLPSDQNLRNQLIISGGFKDDVVDRFIQEFKATAEFAGLFDSGIIGGKGGTGGPDPEDDEENGGDGTGAELTPKPRTPPNPPALEVGMKQDVFALDSGQVTIQWPATLSKADFDDIDAWLNILKRKIQRGIKGDKEPEPKDGPSE